MLTHFFHNNQRRVTRGIPYNANAFNVDALVHLMASTSGSNVLVTNGLPLPKGVLSPTDVANRKLQIIVNGTEKPCYVEAMPGLHPDGSVRSVYFQFYHDILDATPISGTFRIGDVRNTADIAKTTLTHDMFWVTRASASWGYDVDPTAAMLPTSPSYLCSTDATFQPLSPASEDSAEDIARFQTHFDARMNALRTNTTSRNGSNAAFFQSTYDTPRALLSQWCRTGNVQWWKDALTLTYRFNEYVFPTGSYNGWNPNPNVFSESRMKVNAAYVAANGSELAEAGSQRMWSYASCWQACGYVPFYTAVNIYHQNNNQSNRTTYSSSVQINGNAGWLEQYYGLRANIKKMQPQLIAYCIGANRRTTTPSGWGNRDYVFATELPYIIDALWVNRWARGDWRDGVSGIWYGNTDGTNNGYPNPEDFETFQIPLINGFLMSWEREVYADSRIPTMVKANTNAFLLNCRDIRSAADDGYGTAGWGCAYSMRRDYPASVSGSVQSYYVAMALPELAYCATLWPSDVVNGATYDTWYSRFVDVSNNANDSNVQDFDYGQWPRGMKIMGEQFSYTFAAPYIRRNGIPAGPSTLRSISVPSQWPLI